MRCEVTMAQIIKAILFQPEATPPNWIFQLITDDVPGDWYRTMLPDDADDPSKITLPDPEDPSVTHDLVVCRLNPNG